MTSLALGMALTACSGEEPAPAPTVSTPALTPANTVATLAPIGDTQVTTEPVWKNGDDPTSFLINVLRYTQTLATHGGIPVPAGGLKYHVLTAGQVLECDKTRTPSTVDGSQGYYAIMWCPVFKGFVVLPQFQKDTPDLIMLAGAFYGDGVAQFVQAGEPEVEGSCYHGLIVRQAINTGQVKWNVGIEAFREFYDGGDYTNEGLLSGTCKNLK